MMAQGNNKRKFRPELTVFHQSSKILPELLQDVVRNYKKGKRICKGCYYRRKIVSEVDGEGRWKCGYCDQRGDTVWLMPASVMCENFGRLAEVPIPPAPHKHNNKPYSFCAKQDHFKCFDRSAYSDIWFAHTIEELVIWTIEREYKCSFNTYIANHYDKVKKKKKSNRSNIYIDIDDFISSSNDDSDEVVWDPEVDNIRFKSINDIPQSLMNEVIKCYMECKEVCKYCYYLKMEEIKRPPDHTSCPMCKKPWKSIKVIPASSMCNNFGNLQSVPISDVPYISPLPYEYCTSLDHVECFKYYEFGFSYAHSVEELVVWTVEATHGDFMKYIHQYSNTITSPQPTIRQYSPDHCLFRSISDIPNDLHSSVANCFKKVTNVCRRCYFDSLDGWGYTSSPALVYRQPQSGICANRHTWHPIRVIPSSDMCQSYGTYIAIPPPPQHMMNNKGPFKVCSMAHHKSCFDKTKDNNPWFPHTVEEMVIWTIERETGEDYSTVYKEYLNNPDIIDDLTSSSSSHHEVLPSLGATMGRCISQPSLLDNPQATLPHDDVIDNSNSGLNLTYDEATKFFPALLFPKNNITPAQQIHPEPSSSTLNKDDNQMIFQCFLCYREFDTPKEIAEHCMNRLHQQTLRQDCGSHALWRHYPPPPDRKIDEFKLCAKSSNCDNRIRCCKAHSNEELNEWKLRYTFRQSGCAPATPNDIITKSTGFKSVEISGYKGVKIDVQFKKDRGEFVLNISGQGWQTLIGVLCMEPFRISSIKGDTIYSIFPCAATWSPPSFEEGILLGGVVITIKAPPITSTVYDCHVKLCLGSMEMISITLNK